MNRFDIEDQTAAQSSGVNKQQVDALKHLKDTVHGRILRVSLFGQESIARFQPVGSPAERAVRRVTGYDDPIFA